MAYPLGGIVVARDPFGAGGERPYLLVSNETHPFHGEEYVAAVVTTTDRDRAVVLADDVFTAGSLPRRSVVSPWNPVTLKDEFIDTHVATVTGGIVDEVVTELCSYVGTR